MRKGSFALVLLTGLCVGFGGHALYDHSTFDRSTRMVSLFTDYCLNDPPSAPDAYNLVRKDENHRSKRWIDIKSRSFLTVKERTCSLTVYDEHNLSKDEFLSLVTQVETLIGDRFPELSLEQETTQTDPLTQYSWMAGRFWSDERWGISIFPVLVGSDTGSTHLTFYSPSPLPLWGRSGS